MVNFLASIHFIILYEKIKQRNQSYKGYIFFYIVGVLGDKYVGKSYLCHKMTDRNYKGY
jgi:riboflavin transporter FmnP